MAIKNRSCFGNGEWTGHLFGGQFSGDFIIDNVRKGQGRREVLQDESVFQRWGVTNQGTMDNVGHKERKNMRNF